jgi:hypothetical protein
MGVNVVVYYYYYYLTCRVAGGGLTLRLPQIPA